MRRVSPLLALVPALAAWLLAACGRDDPSRATLSVFAASSLTDAFADLERGFEADHPDVDVSTILAGSQVLRLQIEQGASADVFASADARHMAALADAGLVHGGTVFARNGLAVVVPLDNPAGIGSFEDLPRATRIVVGAGTVPIGAYTEDLLRNATSRLGTGFVARIREHVVSEESNVRLVRAKVELGEADAAIVYRTDAVASDAVRVVAIPEDLNVRADYHIGRVERSARPELARRFVTYVLSDEGRRILGGHGFLTTP